MPKATAAPRTLKSSTTNVARRVGGAPGADWTKRWCRAGNASHRTRGGFSFRLRSARPTGTMVICPDALPTQTPRLLRDTYTARSTGAAVACMNSS